MSIDLNVHSDIKIELKDNLDSDDEPPRHYEDYLVQEIIEVVDPKVENVDGENDSQFELEIITVNESTPEGLENSDTIVQSYCNVINGRENIFPASLQKIRLSIPRYPGDICSATLETPRDVEYCIKLLKENLEKKNRKINALHRQIKRLKTKVTSMKKIIDDLNRSENENNGWR